MERKLPVKRAWNRDRDRAIMCLDFDAEERARLDRRWVDVLPTNNGKDNQQSVYKAQDGVDGISFVPLWL